MLKSLNIYLEYIGDFQYFCNSILPLLIYHEVVIHFLGLFSNRRVSLNSKVGNLMEGLAFIIK